MTNFFHFPEQQSFNNEFMDQLFDLHASVLNTQTSGHAYERCLHSSPEGIHTVKKQLGYDLLTVIFDAEAILRKEFSSRELKTLSSMFIQELRAAS